MPVHAQRCLPVSFRFLILGMSRLAVCRSASVPTGCRLNAGTSFPRWERWGRPVQYSPSASPRSSSFPGRSFRKRVSVSPRRTALSRGTCPARATGHLACTSLAAGESRFRRQAPQSRFRPHPPPGHGRDQSRERRQNEQQLPVSYELHGFLVLTGGRDCLRQIRRVNTPPSSVASGQGLCKTLYYYPSCQPELSCSFLSSLVDSARNRLNSK